jgi:thiosulfate reductase cytochrome b subunit
MARRTEKPEPPPVRIVRKHHWLVRVSHWANVPILLGMTISGLAIYWASPVFHHAPDPKTGNTDYVNDVGNVLVHLIPGAAPSPTWLYDHFTIGSAQLALALRLHWFFAYLFMANGALWAIGLLVGRGFKALLPRRSDFGEAWRMVRYYAGKVPMALRRRPWPHPERRGKYNALQRGAYASMAVAGVLAIASGWAMHKPAQLGWLARLFGGYDTARVWHFFLMLFFASFVAPHVVLVFADGWDTFRSMITGWSRHAAQADVPPLEVPREPAPEEAAS